MTIKKSKRSLKTALIRRILQILPKKKRHAIFRNLTSCEESYPKELTFKLVETQQEFVEALTILHDEYVRSGFMKPHETGMRITPYHSLPSTSTLIAKLGDEVIATISIIRSSPYGFPLEHIFDVEMLKDDGARLAEISSLAIKKSYQGNKGHVLFPLLKYLYMYCVHYFGVDYMLIAVNPNRIEFYEALLFFERLTEKSVDNYDFVNGAPAVGAYLDLRKAYAKFASYYGTKPNKKNLFRFFTETDLPNFKFPDRTFFNINDPFLTPEMLHYFFKKKSSVFDDMSIEQISIVRHMYKGAKYLDVIPNDRSTELPSASRRQVRYDVKCFGRIILSDDRFVSMNIIDISMDGLKAVLDLPVRFGKKLNINIAVAEFKIASLVGHPTWKNDEGLYGIKIVNSCDAWKQFVKHVETAAMDPHQKEFRIEISDGTYFLTGRFDENADISQLSDMNEGPLKMNLGGLAEMNSPGIKAWINFIGELGETTLELYECTDIFIDAVSMIPAMIPVQESDQVIKSVKLNYRCQKCNKLTSVSINISEIELTDGQVTFGDQICSSCGANISGDEIEAGDYQFLFE